MPEVEQNKDVVSADVQTTGASAGVDNENDWAFGCVTAARKDNPLVTTTASGILTELLRGLLSERALTPGELTSLAKQLVGGMDSTAPPKSTGGESVE
jgi:hypothetical protein